VKGEVLKEFSTFRKFSPGEKLEASHKPMTSGAAANAHSTGTSHPSHTHAPLASNAPTNVSIAEYQKMRSAYQTSSAMNQMFAGAQPTPQNSTSNPFSNNTAVPLDSETSSRSAHVVGSKAVDTANEWCKEAATEKNTAEVTLQEREKWVAEIEKLLMETEVESKRRLKKAHELEEQLMSAKKAAHESIQQIWEIRRNLEEARAGVKTAEIALHIKEAQCSVATIVAQRTLHSMEVLANHAAASSPTDPYSAPSINPPLHTAPSQSSAPPSRPPPPPPCNPAPSLAPASSSPLHLFGPSQTQPMDPKAHAAVAPSTAAPSAAADLESLFGSTGKGFFLSDGPVPTPLPPKPNLIPDLANAASPADTGGDGGNDVPIHHVSWQQMFGVEERSESEQAEVKAAPGLAETQADPEAAMRAYAVQRSAEEARQQKQRLRQQRQEASSELKAAARKAEIVANAAPEVVGDGGQEVPDAFAPGLEFSAVKKCNQPQENAKDILTEKLTRVMPTNHTLRHLSTHVPGIESRKAMPGDPCNRYCSLECICKCICAVLLVLDQPGLEGGVVPSRTQCRSALRRAKIAFHPDRSRGSAQAQEYALEVSKTLNELEMRLAEVTHVVTMLKFSKDPSLECRLRVDLNLTVRGLKEQIVQELDASFTLESMNMAVEGGDCGPMQDERSLGHYHVKDMTVFVLTLIGPSTQSVPRNSNNNLTNNNWAQF